MLKRPIENAAHPVGELIGAQRTWMTGDRVQRGMSQWLSRVRLISRINRSIDQRHLQGVVVEEKHLVVSFGDHVSLRAIFQRLET